MAVLSPNTTRRTARPYLARLRAPYEAMVERLLFACAASCVIAVLAISFFVISSGLPLMNKVGWLDFLLGRQWQPLQGVFGIFPMVVGSILVTGGSLVLAVPLGIAGATFMAEFAPERVASILRPMIQLLAGIPSVVYGFWGLIVLVPFLRGIFGGSGFSALGGSVILGIMILPTLINVSEDALRSVPQEYRDASLALGATKWQTVRRVLLPAARSGILTAIALGLGRSIGETMAVIMVVGNVPGMPKSFFDPVRTMTGNVVIEIGYAYGDHQQALFATGVVLFSFIMVLNVLTHLKLKGRRERREP